MISAYAIYDKAIYLKSETNPKIKHLLCEYSLSKSTGFPVTVRYKNEEFSCNTIDILKSTLKDILTTPKQQWLWLIYLMVKMQIINTTDYCNLKEKNRRKNNIRRFSVYLNIRFTADITGAGNGRRRHPH